LEKKSPLLLFAETPLTSEDFYTSVFWSKDFDTSCFNIELNLQINTLVALSISGYLVEINPDNGKFIQDILIK
jgi:hypothetical protein